MQTYLLDKTEKLLKTHPNLVIFILVCCVATLITSMALASDRFVSKEDFGVVTNDIKEIKSNLDHVNKSVSEITTQIEITRLQQRSVAIEAEVYQLERLEQSNEANSRDIDRLLMLRAEYNEVNRRLNALYGSL